MQTDFSVREVFFALCKSIDTPVSLGAWLRFEYNQNALASMSIRPESYKTAASFALDYSVVSFLSKWKGLKTGIDLEDVALQSFKISEESCKTTNKRLKNFSNVAIPRFHSIFHAAQRKIAKLLGPYEDRLFRDTCGWGPGATSDLPRRRAFLDTKICELPIPVSRSALSKLRSEIESDLHWSFVILGHVPEGPYSLLRNVFVITNECKITTVPKSAKTDRVIAIEPRGNSFLQKGFGGYLRKRLRKVGIDLDNQETNQTLAKAAVSEGLATLDLKAASDTVSSELVWALLPYDWAESMDSVRSHYAAMPSGELVRLEKFSSMGNGFTFELETLIFWALSSATKDFYSGEGPVAVYGDDIIVHRSYASELIEVLRFAGFETNETKSFVSGQFFESCGRHYFSGLEVTPAYQKEEIGDETCLIRMGNRLIRLSFRLAGRKGLERKVLQAWRACFRQRTHLRWAIPFGDTGDDGWSLPYEVFPFRFGSNPNHGVKSRVFVHRQKQFIANDGALFAWSLRRGVVTETDYNGSLSRVQEGAPPSDGFRWIIPTGQFSVRLV